MSNAKLNSIALDMLASALDPESDNRPDARETATRALEDNRTWNAVEAYLRGFYTQSELIAELEHVVEACESELAEGQE